MTTALTWLLAAAGLAVLPGPHRRTRRVTALARAGRLAVVAPVPARGRRAPATARRALAPPDPRLLLRRAGVVLVPIVAAVAAGSTAGAAPAVAAAAVAATAWLLGWRAADTAAASRARAALVQAVRLMVAEVDAGATTATALAAAAGAGGPHAPHLAEAASLGRRGGDPATALDGTPLAAVGQAVRVAEVTGSALSPVLSRVAADLVAEQDQHRAAAVALAGPRSSAVLLAGLPVLGIGLGVAMGAHPVAFLLHSGPGRMVGAAGVLLDVAGVWWVAAVLRRAQRA